MIYDLSALKNRFNKYSNLNQKLELEMKKGNLIKIRNGLYSDNIYIDGPLIANLVCSPSYISFEYALSYYGLIPERVTIFTSAIFNKRNYKLFNNGYLSFEYQSIPNRVYSYGITYLENEEKIKYKIASKEKALCDLLYKKYPLRSIKDLKILLFEDLRVDENEFMKLNFSDIKEIAPLYHKNTLNILVKFIKEIEKNGYKY